MTHRIGNIIDLVAYRAEKRGHTRTTLEDEIDALLALAARTRNYYVPVVARDNVVQMNVRKNNG